MCFAKVRIMRRNKSNLQNFVLLGIYMDQIGYGIICAKLSGKIGFQIYIIKIVYQ